VGTLFIVFFLTLLMKEYGPMLAAQRRAVNEHKVVGDNADQNQVSIDEVDSFLPAPTLSALADGSLCRFRGLCLLV
jgi:hypothetical protein